MRPRIEILYYPMSDHHRHSPTSIGKAVRRYTFPLLDPYLTPSAFFIHLRNGFMESHYHAAPAPVLNRVMQPDAAGAFHVFEAIKALEEAGDDERCFGEAKLFCGMG